MARGRNTFRRINGDFILGGRRYLGTKYHLWGLPLQPAGVGWWVACVPAARHLHSAPHIGRNPLLRSSSVVILAKRPPGSPTELRPLVQGTHLDLTGWLPTRLPCKAAECCSTLDFRSNASARRMGLPGTLISFRLPEHDDGGGWRTGRAAVVYWQRWSVLNGLSWRMNSVFPGTGMYDTNTRWPAPTSLPSALQSATRHEKSTSDTQKRYHRPRYLPMHAIIAPAPCIAV